MPEEEEEEEDEDDEVIKKLVSNHKVAGNISRMAPLSSISEVTLNKSDPVVRMFCRIGNISKSLVLAYFITYALKYEDFSY